MKTTARYVTYALGISVTAALLAACGNNSFSSASLVEPSAVRPAAMEKSGRPNGRATGLIKRVLYQFQGGTDGAGPDNALIDVNGTLFGTTGGGGSTGSGSGGGTIFSLNTSGSGYQTLHRYSGGAQDGVYVQQLSYANGELYGTTFSGGDLNCNGLAGYLGCGTVFKMRASGGSYTILYRFAGPPDGKQPKTALLNVNNVLYGMTDAGGSGTCAIGSPPIGGCGALFAVSSKTGKEQILYNFQGRNDGYFPVSYGLIDLDGTLFGTTFAGGETNCGGPSGLVGCGTLFHIRPSGNGYRVVYRFHFDSGRPNNVIAVNGILYGSTSSGGRHYPCGTVGCGSLFKFDLKAHRFTLLYQFHGGSDGAYPNSLLAYANGALYSTTIAGGGSSKCYGGCGTVFKFDVASGSEKVIYRFQGGADGGGPSALIESNGTLYGTAGGGTKRHGYVFSMSP